MGAQDATGDGHLRALNAATTLLDFIAFVALLFVSFCLKRGISIVDGYVNVIAGECCYVNKVLYLYVLISFCRLT